MKSLPQRLVFFDCLTPKLDGIRERYLEVCPSHLFSDVPSVRDFLIRDFMMIGGDMEM